MEKVGTRQVPTLRLRLDLRMLPLHHRPSHPGSSGPFLFLFNDRSAQPIPLGFMTNLMKVCKTVRNARLCKFSEFIFGLESKEYNFLLCITTLMKNDLSKHAASSLFLAKHYAHLYFKPI
jgi:hypothetical protein